TRTSWRSLADGIRPEADAGPPLTVFQNRTFSPATIFSDPRDENPSGGQKMDLVQWAVLIAFEGIIGGTSVLLSLTYLSFARMEKDVRRARMFIMADRIKRFLGAFTAGFVVLAVTFSTAFLGITLPAAVATGAFF